MLKVGHILRCHYRIEEVLGQGGFGIVYRVKDLDLKKNNLFIIKELFLNSYSFRQSGDNKVYVNQGAIGFIKKIKRDVIGEVNILSEIENENVLKAYGYFEENDTIYSIMEYIDGVDLEKHLRKNGVFSEEDAIDLLEQLIHALLDVHRRDIIHRDIKPSNIMLTKSGIYKIIDFTTNKRYSNSEIEITDIKSHGYTSPELEKRRARIGEFSDIYSIGMVIFKVLSLKNPPKVLDRYDDDDIPFQETIDSLGVSDKLKNLIKGMTEIDVNDRIQNLDEVMRILNDEIDALPIGYQIENYKIKKVLGQSSFTISYLANEINGEEKFIIKEFYINRYSERGIYKKDVVTKRFDINIIEKFYVEQRPRDMIGWEGILSVYKARKKNRTIYSIVQYINDGIGLEKYSQNHHFSEDEIMSLLMQLSNSLSFFHSKKRILKILSPSNIIRMRSGIYKIDYLLNPIFALEPYFDNNTVPLEIEPYCSKEVLEDKDNIGEYSDIYSLGMIICSVLMKDKENLLTVANRSINEDRLEKEIYKLNISSKLKRIIIKMVKIDHKDRFQNLEELFKAKENSFFENFFQKFW